MKNTVHPLTAFHDGVNFGDGALVKFQIIDDVRNILFTTGGKIIQDDDLVSLYHQSTGKMRTDKSGSPGHQISAHELKSLSLSEPAGSRV